jgi:putative ABC transport system permease protein
MLRHYLIITFRHLWKNRLYALLTSTGLSVAIVCLLLAVLYAQDEWSYDQFHEKIRICTGLPLNW